MKALTVHMPDDLLKKINKYRKQASMDVDSSITQLIKIGLKQWKIEQGVEMYANGKATLWKAAEIADVSLYEMMEVIKKRKIPAQFDKSALEEEIKRIKTII